MNDEQLYNLALEVLTATNVYDRNIEEMKYTSDGDEYLLIDLIKYRIPEKRYRKRTSNEYQVVFNVIKDALLEYCGEYKSSFSFKQQVRTKFKTWLERIRDEYHIDNVIIPEEFIVQDNELDTAIVMVKELHSRSGVTKKDLQEKLDFNNTRAVQKNLRKLCPTLYEGIDEDKEKACKPFRVGGQPIVVDIKEKDNRKDDRKYYYTPNTLHPLVLQENLTQVGVLLKGLSKTYHENELSVSIIIGIDIWSQLSDYAKERIEVIFAQYDEELSEFIEILKDEYPDNRALGFKTERQMFELDIGRRDALIIVAKSNSRKCTVFYTDKEGNRYKLNHQRIKQIDNINEQEAYKLISPDNTIHIVTYDEIDDIIIEPLL